MKLLFLCLSGFVLTASAVAQDKITYADHVLPLVENHCGKCHNPDKRKGDLDLTSYAGVLKGGGSGPVVVSGNPDSSKLWKAITQVEEPTMPPNKPPLPEKELAVFKQWIAGGLLETSGSKAIVSTKRSLDLSVKVSTVGKPDGPPPMPGELPLETVVHTTRGNPINGLATSPWAPLAAIAGQKEILLYHTTSLELLGILPFAEGQPWDLKFSRSGKLLLAGGGHGAKSGGVLLWNIETGERIAALGKEYDIVLAADISPDQSRIALGGPDRLIKIYSTKNGELEHKIKKHTDWITALAFSPDGEFLVSGDRNGGVSLWDPDNGQELFTTAGHKGSVTAASWRGDSKVVATSSEDGSVKIWETSEGKMARTWVAHAAGALAVAFAHDGKFVTAGRDGGLTSWAADGSKLKAFETGGEPVLRCAFTHDDARIVATDFAGRVGIWDAKDGKRIGALDANPLPLAERLEAARHRLQELTQGIASVPTATIQLGPDCSKLSNDVVAAREAVDRAQAKFDAEAKEVVRWKAAAGGADPSAAALVAARAAREKVRVTLTNAVASLEQKKKQLRAAEEKGNETIRTPDRKAELAATQSLVDRLSAAQSLATVRQARETVAARQQDLDRCQAVLKAKQAEIETLTRGLKTARGGDEKSKLKAALKAANRDAKAAEPELKKAMADLESEQAHLDQVLREHEQVKIASRQGAKAQAP